MKKVGPILTLLLLLGAGMHLSIATHICLNQIAAVKVSFTGERVTCGMHQKSLEHSSTPSLVNDCCKDFLSAFSLSDKWFDPLFSGHIFQNRLGRSIVILLSKDSPRSEFVKGNTSDDTLFFKFSEVSSPLTNSPLWAVGGLTG